MTAREHVVRGVQTLAAVAALALDVGLFWGPRIGHLMLFGRGSPVDAHVYMFRTEDSECVFPGTNTNGTTFWLPQWDCSPVEGLRYGLFAGVALCAAVIVVSRRRDVGRAAGWALASMQAVATATALLEGGANNVVGAVLGATWVPLLCAVTVQRAPRAWRGRMALALAGVIAAGALFTAARLVEGGATPSSIASTPPWHRSPSLARSVLLGAYWYAHSLVAVALFVGVAYLVRRGAHARRIGVGASAVALGGAGAAVVGQAVAGLDPSDVVPMPSTLLWVASALALTVVVVACAEELARTTS